MSRMHPVRVPRTLPAILSQEAVRRLIAAVGKLKQQTALQLAYGAGLRASDELALKAATPTASR